MKYWLFILSVLFYTVVLGQEDCFYDNEELGTSCLMCYKNLEKHVNENMEFKPLWYIPKTRSSLESMRENQLSEKINNDNNTKPVSLELDITPKIFDRGLIKGNEKFEVQFTIPKNNILTNKLKFTINYRQEDWSFEMALVDDSLSLEDKKNLVIEKYPLEKNRGKIKIRLFEDLNHNLILELCQPYQSECSKIGTYKIIEGGDISKVKKIIFNAVEKKNTIKDFEFFFIKNNNTSPDAPINEKFVESSKNENTNSNNEYLSGNKVYALYIYNSDYINNEILSKLSNPGKDAKALDRALKLKIGEEFYSSDSIFNLKTNQMNLREILKPERIEKMNGKDIIIVHFGGHGFSLDGINHWVPIDFDGVIKETNNPKFDLNTLEGRKNETKKQVNDDLRYSITPYILLERLNNSLEDKIIIVISDACRNEITFKFENEPPLSSDRGVVISDENNSITPDFDHSQSNSKKNHLFLQYSVKNNQTANDNNSYTKVLSQKINSKEDILYKFDGNFNNILIEPFKIISSDKSSSPKTNNIALLLYDFNFMVTPWKEYLRNNPKN
jgi:hypothetical protein